ncbi:hypothetical protein RRG12_36765 [Nostoc sp. CALU 546]
MAKVDTSGFSAHPTKLAKSSRKYATPKLIAILTGAISVILAIANSRAISDDKLPLTYKGGSKSTVKNISYRNNYGIKTR